MSNEERLWGVLQWIVIPAGASVGGRGDELAECSAAAGCEESPDAAGEVVSRAGFRGDWVWWFPLFID